MIKKYRKKPVVVEAVQWTGKNHVEMCEFIDWEVLEIRPKEGLIIHTLEGDHHASPGDYIIKGVNGEFYPCKPDIFSKTYESEADTPQLQWISVEDRLPEAEKEVWIACKTKPSGYLYQCVGFYIPHGFYQEDSDYTWDWETLGEYSEERDDYCINEGWYERVHNWDDYGAVSIGDFVTHWMPLPQPPKEAQP